MQEYYEPFYPHEFDNLGKMDRLLERCKLPKSILKETDNLKNIVKKHGFVDKRNSHK